MIVDILYFEGCPNHGPTRALVCEVLAESGVVAKIREIEVANHREAQTMRFIGSHTVRVDGIDIEPAARSLDRFGMICRVYRTGHALTGTPPRKLLEDAIARAAEART